MVSGIRYWGLLWLYEYILPKGGLDVSCQGRTTLPRSVVTRSIQFYNISRELGLVDSRLMERSHNKQHFYDNFREYISLLLKIEDLCIDPEEQ